MLIMQLLRDNLTVGFYWHHFLHLTFTSHNLLLMANMVSVNPYTPVIKKLEPWLPQQLQLTFFFYLFSSNISLNIDFFFFFFYKDPVFIVFFFSLQLWTSDEQGQDTEDCNN